MRSGSYGQARPLSFIDRLGVYLSRRRVLRVVRGRPAATVVDFGCGFHASLALSLLGTARSATVFDLAVAPEVYATPGVRVVEGKLPETARDLPGGSAGLVLCISVLEHLDSPVEMLDEIHRVLAPGGTAIINVPSWRGKWFLELAAFRLGLAPREEMNDHKRYYDPRDLWPQLVSAGFLPENVRCRHHKFGLNTFAVCTAPTEPKK